MKRVLLTFAVGILTFSSVVQAQEKKMAVKLNFLSPILTTGNLHFQYAFSEKGSVNVPVFYMFGVNRADVDLDGFGFVPGFRFNPSGQGLKGFYVEPFFSFWSFSLEAPFIDANFNTVQATASWTVVGGGLALGYQALIGDLITLDVFFGPKFGSGSVTYDDPTQSFETPNLSGVGVRFGATVGVAF